MAIVPLEVRWPRKGVEAWEARWGAVPDAPALRPEVDVATLLEDYAERMDATLPFFHPRYAGQMLKPPHPVAVAAYLAAMIVNPNNHALDASQATSPMEVEVMRGLGAMFGLPEEALGHLTSSGTIANLEALWVARELARPPSSAWLLGLTDIAMAYAARAMGCGGFNIWPA